MTPSQPLRSELVAFSDYAWQRLRDRLVGLTHDEYLWEPVAGCWTIRLRPDGFYNWDFDWPQPDPPPVTTIAWRLAHLVIDDRFRSGLGLGSCPDRPPRPVPGSAAAAIEAVEAVKAERHDDLLEVTDDDLWQTIGTVGGPYADGTRFRGCCMSSMR